jgi:hypothetical protein
MEHLEIKSGPRSVIRTAIGILNLVTALLMFIVFIEEKKLIPILASLFIAINGIYLLTNGFGLERCWFKTGEDYIIIKWSSKIRPVQIHNTRISKISLERTRIVIHQKSMKPLKLNLGFMEREQKKEVYEFLIGYSKKKNINLEKHSSTLL